MEIKPINILEVKEKTSLATYEKQKERLEAIKKEQDNQRRFLPEIIYDINNTINCVAEKGKNRVLINAQKYGFNLIESEIIKIYQDADFKVEYTGRDLIIKW